MSLFLKTAKYKNGKTYLSIVDGYRVDGKVKQKVYKKIGYLEDLEKQFDDPISHFKKEVEILKKQFISKNKLYTKVPITTKQLKYLF